MKTTEDLQDKIPDKHKGGQTAMDIKLFKFIGLYQTLQPCESGGFNDRYRRTILNILWLPVGLQTMQIVRLYLELADLQSAMYVVVSSAISVVCTLKGYVIATNAERLWILTDAALYGFTSCGRRDPSELRKRGNEASAILRFFTCLFFITSSIWIIGPWFADKPLKFYKMDGTVGLYRKSVYNLWLPLSEDMYNWLPIWTFVYIIEAVLVLVYMFSWLMFDCYFLTLCLALNAQLQNIQAAYQRIGHSSPPSHVPWSADLSNGDNTTKAEFYEELILIIKDNQKIIENLDEFFDFIRSVVLVQITFGSYSMVTLIFFTITSYLMGMSIFSAQILTYFSGYGCFAFGLYLYCYTLNSLETMKSSINFGLYSCNWTVMDLKFKRTMLLAMRMNASHKRVMKMSPNSIINMEMFTRLMKMSYTIVSVLLNVRKE